MTQATNPYCEVLGIKVPSLELAKKSRDANYYSLLIVVILERGGPVTLEDAAQRFAEAGVAPADKALASLKRCKPGRPPIYREDDLYALDPHDHETDLWVFRLGLRPSKGDIFLRDHPEPVPEPLPSLDQNLTVKNLDDAWRFGLPANSSAQRIALCVLDAHQKPMKPEDVVSFVAARSDWSRLSVDSAKYWRRGAAIRVREDGRWEMVPGHSSLRSARKAVRASIEAARRRARYTIAPSVREKLNQHFETERQKRRDNLAKMRRALLYAFPAHAPEALVLLDVARHEITTFFGDEIHLGVAKLESYDWIGAIEVRKLLRTLEFKPGTRRLGELGPAQKTRKLNRRGRTLKITNTLLVQSSCSISKPFGDPKTLLNYLKTGQITRLRRRLEADAKSLFALYQYGKLHGCVRLRWGFLDEHILAPWANRDEIRVGDLLHQAKEFGMRLEVVAGSAPGWSNPWSRGRKARVEQDGRGFFYLVDDHGHEIERQDIQLARFEGEDEPVN